MKKILFFLFISIYANSQTVKVAYAENAILSERALAENPKYVNEKFLEENVFSLIHSNGFSMYRFNPQLNPKVMSDIIRQGENVLEEDGTITIMNTPDISNNFFKDFKNKSYVFKFLNGNKVFDGKDTFLNWDWILTNKSKLILGYNCQLGKVEKNGLIYSAWFTNEIPAVDGPNRYTGLPGLILEFSNKYFQIIAQQVVVEKENTILEKPIEEKEYFTLQGMFDYLNKTTRTPSTNLFGTDPNIKMETRIYKN